jgi:hypothetical protein
MKRTLSVKGILVVVCICFILTVIGLGTKAADDPIDVLKAIKKKCTDYCSKYPDDYVRMACIEGCLVGSAVPLT